MKKSELIAPVVHAEVERPAPHWSARLIPAAKAKSSTSVLMKGREALGVELVHDPGIEDERHAVEAGLLLSRVEKPPNE